jgi:hypothetical protein
MRTAVFRLCGHVEIGPIAVLAQSKARILSPNSPPPENTSSGVCPSVGNEDTLLDAGDSDCCLRMIKDLIYECRFAKGVSLLKEGSDA